MMKALDLFPDNVACAGATDIYDLVQDIFQSIMRRVIRARTGRLYEIYFFSFLLQLFAFMRHFNGSHLSR